ncbi:hypothetical protein [Bdellovibrio sp. HCB337]|uniref:hypothetical protein n=1 Tax=Bdellovibrio sp. HCB337 TaxID=3394358 RepID=UPI0039A62919
MRFFSCALSVLSVFFTGSVFAAVCTAPTVYTSCCDYAIHDGVASKDVNYRGPQTAFADAGAAQTWAKGVVPQMPFYLPYDANKVSILRGWLSDNGSGNSAVDSWRASVAPNTDASFEVRAVAQGKVVSKLWDNWHGNVVVIEHTAANGSKYRSLYFHLRNGYTHDRKAASAIVPPDPNGNDITARYARFAKANDSKLYWGEESHVIPVNVGDEVKARQVIAYSGNTGVGGAGAGLKNDGTPSNALRANNHLHFMMAVPSPTKGDEWVFVDPYGVYGKVSSSCYAIMKEIDYPRFFVPFYATFHNINWDLYKFYSDYYPKMSWGPQTLSVYKAGTKIKAAGAFHPKAEKSWAARGYLTEEQLNKALKAFDKDDMRPRELQVTTAPDGSPRFTAIWQKHGGNSFTTLVNLKDDDFAKKFRELVESKGYRIEDHVSYSVSGERRHSAILVKDGQGAQYWHNMTQDDYTHKVQYLSANGWRNTSFNAAELPWGLRYSGVWMQKPGTWASWFNLNAANYQQKFDQYSTQGLRLWRIQGYNDGNSFGAIWTN